MKNRIKDEVGAHRLSSEGQGQSVLVVEDDPVIIDLLRDIVTSFGFKVEVAENAAEALSCFETSGRRAACVILDYGIPGMDTSRLLSCMREIDSNVKVLLSSGYSRAFVGKEFPLDTVHGFLPKPYEPLKLMEEMRRVMELE